MTSPPRLRLCIIADASDSALAHWKIIRQTVLRLCRLLEARFAIDVYLLGDLQPLALAWFEQQRQLEPSFPRRIACSLITPTIRALLKGTSKHVHAIVMVGNGEIVDVVDWLDEPKIERWVAVQAGPDQLCSNPSITTWPHGQIDDIIVSINRASVHQPPRGHHAEVNLNSYLVSENSLPKALTAVLFLKASSRDIETFLLRYEIQERDKQITPHRSFICTLTSEATASKNLLTKLGKVFGRNLRVEQPSLQQTEDIAS